MSRSPVPLRSAIGGLGPIPRSYGIGNDAAAEVGLTCGGTIEVVVDRFSAASFPDYPRLAAALETDRAIACATILDHPDPIVRGRRILVSQDELGNVRSSLDAAIATDALSLLESERPAYSATG